MVFTVKNQLYPIAWYTLLPHRTLSPHSLYIVIIVYIQGDKYDIFSHYNNKSSMILSCHLYRYIIYLSYVITLHLFIHNLSLYTQRLSLWLVTNCIPEMEGVLFGCRSFVIYCLEPLCHLFSVQIQTGDMFHKLWCHSALPLMG